MEKQPDYYSVLQVDPRAEREVIEAAYRRLAAKYHPDVDASHGATERMSLLNAAYETLSKPDSRRAYDLTRGVTTPSQPDRAGRPSPGHSPRGAGIDWGMSLVVTGFMLALSVVLPRFGFRGLLIVALLFLGLWLLVRVRNH